MKSDESASGSWRRLATTGGFRSSSRDMLSNGARSLEASEYCSLGAVRSEGEVFASVFLRRSCIRIQSKGVARKSRRRRLAPQMLCVMSRQCGESVNASIVLMGLHEDDVREGGRWIPFFGQMAGCLLPSLAERGRRGMQPLFRCRKKLFWTIFTVQYLDEAGQLDPEMQLI